MSASILFLGWLLLSAMTAVSESGSCLLCGLEGGVLGGTSGFRGWVRQVCRGEAALYGGSLCVGEEALVVSGSGRSTGGYVN